MASCSETGWRQGDPSGVGEVTGRNTAKDPTCFLEGGGGGHECAEGEPVDSNILGVACNLYAWWEGCDGIENDSSGNCIFCSACFSETGRVRRELRGGEACSNSISSSALNEEASWRERDPSWDDDVESSNVNGSASFFGVEERGCVYSEGVLANIIICGSADTFDVERGGQDGVGNESSKHSIFRSVRCFATQMRGCDGGAGGTGGIGISNSARCSESGWRQGVPVVLET
jgi:hypothetical protein